MVIDSIQVSPLHLPFQAWPMMMAPAYGGGEPLAPQGGPTMGALGSLWPGPATPMMVPWGGQPAYVGGPPVPQSVFGGLGGPWVPQAAPAPGAVGGPWGSPAAVGPLPITPASEQQALHTLMQEVTAGAIRKLPHYPEAHSPKDSQLGPRLPHFHQDAQALGAPNT